MHVQSSVQKCYKLHWWFTWALALELCPSQTLAINVSVVVAASGNTLLEGRAPEAARGACALRTGGVSKAGIGGTVHCLIDWFYMCRGDMIVLFVMTSQDTTHVTWHQKMHHMTPQNQYMSQDVTWGHMTSQQHKCSEQLTLWGRTRGSDVRCVIEAFSSAYHIENCEGGWLSGITQWGSTGSSRQASWVLFTATIDFLLSPILPHTCNIKFYQQHYDWKNLYTAMLYEHSWVHSPLTSRGCKQLALPPVPVLPHRQPWTRQDSQEV